MFYRRWLRTVVWTDSQSKCLYRITSRYPFGTRFSPVLRHLFVRISEKSLSHFPNKDLIACCFRRHKSTWIAIMTVWITQSDSHYIWSMSLTLYLSYFLDFFSLTYRRYTRSLFRKINHISTVFVFISIGH